MVKILKRGTHRHTSLYKDMAISNFYFISIRMANGQNVVLMKKLIGKGSVRRPRKRWQDNVKTDRR
jgi:hypothetical protein